MVQGPEFTDIQPKSTSVGLPVYAGGVRFTPNYAGLDIPPGTRQFIVETFNQFRIGQTAFLEFEIFLDIAGVTRVILQPWWLKPQEQFRAVGPTTDPADYIVGDGTDGVDVNAFGPPSAFGLGATDRLWQTETKREDQIAPAFPAVPAGKSFSNMVDNVFAFPINSALVGVGYSFTKSFYWPTHGYALAFTSEFEGVPGAGNPGEITEPVIQLSWKTGATHSISQENVE